MMKPPSGPADQVIVLRPSPSSPSGPLIEVGRHPLLIGRDRGCDIVLLDPHVSRQHALVWYQHDQLRVRDLGSALGTKVGSRRVLAGEVRPVERGEPLRLAGRVTFTWAEPSTTGAVRWSPELSIRRDPQGWTGADVQNSPFPSSVPGQAIDVDQSTTTMHSFTLEWCGSELELGRYTLTIAVERGAPAEARFEDAAGPALMVGGESRVVLLFLLGRQRLLYDSGQAESPWLSDHDLGVGLWGSRSSELPASRLNTLVTRVRNQLQGAGFPRDLVEKQIGETRLGPAVGRVALQGWSKDSISSIP
jgi:hypothetical protein